jgi:hypothetical protein
MVLKSQNYSLEVIVEFFKRVIKKLQMLSIQTKNGEWKKKQKFSVRESNYLDRVRYLKMIFVVLDYNMEHMALDYFKITA